MKKKVYEEPKLVVIVRCRPEESVLGVCKQSRHTCGTSDGPSFVIAAS